MDQVILVNSEGRKEGMAGIEEAHAETGKLHRAISVLLHDGKERVLVQKRANGKLLWPGYWSNTVCTHRNYGSDVLVWARERLKYELGVEIKKKDLSEVYRFEYRARYSDEWSEWEMDHVIVGKYKGEVEAREAEVAEWKWMDWQELREDMDLNPDRYTPWFKLMVDSGKLDRLVA